jgi:bifunctional ADP-heptose synthase (sugar kinase/adenylyltransferase)
MMSLSPARIRDLAARFPGSHVLILGDVMLDHTVIGRVTRISPEAPVPVVEHDRDVYHAGGAANVASNVRALGGVVELVGLVGVDGQADVLRQELRRANVGSDGLVADASRPTSPTSSTTPPSVRTLLATLAAPPA